MHRVFLSAKLRRLTVVKVSYEGQYNRVWVAYIHPRSVHSTLLTLTSQRAAVERGASATRPVPAGLSSLLSNPLSHILFYSTIPTRSLFIHPSCCFCIAVSCSILCDQFYDFVFIVIHSYVTF